MYYVLHNYHMISRHPLRRLSLFPFIYIPENVDSTNRRPCTSPSQPPRLQHRRSGWVSFSSTDQTVSPPPLSRLTHRSCAFSDRYNILHIKRTKVGAIFMNTTRPGPRHSHEIVQNINVHKFIYCLLRQNTNCNWKPRWAPLSLWMLKR